MSTEIKNRYGYIRVSSKEQNEDRQLNAMRILDKGIRIVKSQQIRLNYKIK